MWSILLCQWNSSQASRSAQKTQIGERYFILCDIRPSILVPGNVEISLVREKERTEKSLKLLGETKTLIGQETAGMWEVVAGRSKEGDAKDNTHFYNKTQLPLQMFIQTVQLWSVKHRLSLISSYRILCSTNLKSLAYFPSYTC